MHSCRKGSCNFWRNHSRISSYTEASFVVFSAILGTTFHMRAGHEREHMKERFLQKMDLCILFNGVAED